MLCIHSVTAVDAKDARVPPAKEESTTPAGKRDTEADTERALCGMKFACQSCRPLNDRRLSYYQTCKNLLSRPTRAKGGLLLMATSVPNSYCFVWE